MKKCQGVYNTKKYIEKHNPVLYKHLIEDFDDNLSWRERVLLNKMGLTAPPKCPVCGSLTKFSNEGYRKYCSNKCANRDPDKKQKSILTSIKNYGVEYPVQHKDVKSKIKQTNLRKYGVENPSKTQAIKNKIGLKNSLNWERTKVKYKNTMEKRYGVEWGGQIAKGITTRVAKFKDKQIKEKDFLIGYDGDDWICKCPHEDCTKCQERTYIIKPGVYYDRTGRGAETCTHLLPFQPPISTLELKIRDWLDEMGVDYVANDRRLGQEVDIYIPDLKLAIEVNGCYDTHEVSQLRYWHSTQHKTSSYHIDKSRLLSDHGIRCIFVWDDYKDEDIESFLRALIEDRDLSPWIEKWFPDINGWPADFGLTEGQWQEHPCFHSRYKCYDAGVFI